MAVLLAGRGSRRWWRLSVPVCVVVAGLVIAAAAAALTMWQPWPDALPPVVWAANSSEALLALAWRETTAGGGPDGAGDWSR